MDLIQTRGSRHWRESIITKNIVTKNLQDIILSPDVTHVKVANNTWGYDSLKQWEDTDWNLGINPTSSSVSTFGFYNEAGCDLAYNIQTDRYFHFRLDKEYRIRKITADIKVETNISTVSTGDKALSFLTPLYMDDTQWSRSGSLVKANPQCNYWLEKNSQKTYDVILLLISKTDSNWHTLSVEYDCRTKYILVHGYGSNRGSNVKICWRNIKVDVEE